MNHESPPNSPLAVAVSWVALVLALFCLGGLAVYIPADRPRFERVFADFNLTLPASTELALAIPDVAIWGLAGVFALASAFLQAFMRDKGGVALYNMFIVVLCCVAFTAYRESMVQPLLALMQALAR